MTSIGALGSKRVFVLISKKSIRILEDSLSQPGRLYFCSVLSTMRPLVVVHIFFFAIVGAFPAEEPASNMSSYTVEPITPPRVLGEGPHWDHERQHLYYVDAFRSRIHRYVPSEKKDTYCQVDKSASVSIIIPVKGSKDKFVVTIGKNLTIVTWDGESTAPEKIEVVASIDQEEGLENNRFNDGKVDPTGRLWVGSMGFFNEKLEWEKERGSLYSFPKGSKPVKHFDKLTISNGMAWSSDQKHMYYIDSPTQRVDILDFNAEAGSVSNRRTLFDFAGEDLPKTADPDGMAIDANGNIWVAVFEGYGVFNIDTKTGKVIRKIDVPSKQTTSVAFGGPNLDELYVVSADFKITEEEKKKYPHSGATFRVTGLGVKGLPALRADL